MVGVEMSLDVPALVGQLLQEGFVANCTAGNVLRLLPPLIIQKEHVDAFVAGLRTVLSRVMPPEPAKASSGR